MTLVFDGAEGSTHRRLLAEMGVRDQGVSFYRMWAKGLSKTKPYLLDDRFPADVQLYLDSGFTPAQKRFDTAAAQVYYTDLLVFLDANSDRISAMHEFWFPALGQAWAERSRRELWERLGDRFWPVWDHKMGADHLGKLAGAYANVAVTGVSVERDTSLSARVRSLQTSLGTNFHALATATPDNLRAVPFTTASTMSWISPMMRGETIVWDGGKLVRYRKDDKDRARVRYKRVVESAGLDFEKILADDKLEPTRLAIWSYLQMDKHMTNKKNPPHLTVIKGAKGPDVINSSDEPDLRELMDLLGDDVGSRELEGWKPAGDVERATPAMPRAPHEMQTLPGFGISIREDVTYEGGEEVVQERFLLQSQPGSMRQCDTCFVAANCPAVRPGSMCAFKLPVSVKTKEELKSLLNAVIEMQGSRVAFMKFTEDIGGGYADPNTSQEIDRLFKLVETLNKLEANRDVARITVERETSGGILSAIFGNRAQQLHELPNGGLSESQTTRIIEGDIIQ